jgi:hypothetical protein
MFALLLWVVVAAMWISMYEAEHGAPATGTEGAIINAQAAASAANGGK